MADATAPTGRRDGPARRLLVAAAIGLAAGAAVFLFERAIDAVRWASHGWAAQGWPGAPAAAVALAPVAGGLVVGVVLHLRGVPEEPGHGVTEVIEAVSVGEEAFPARTMPVKAAAAAVSLGSGAALGPEDPAVEMGGGIGEHVGARLGLDRDERQGLVAVGAAAGLAAAFGAPLAAVAFAVEVFALRLASRTVVLVAVAAAVAYGVVLLIEPQIEPSVTAFSRPGRVEVAVLPLVGILAGVVAAAQIRLCYAIQAVVHAWGRVPRWAKPALGGAVVGLIGLALPQVVGIGYGPLTELLSGAVPAAGLVVALVVGKMLAMAVSFGSGMLGGFFAPTLFIGAALGAALGLGGAAVLPDGVAPDPGVLAGAGAVGVLAGCVRAPATATLLAAAMTGSAAYAAPLLLAALPATWVCRRLQAHSIYVQGTVTKRGHPPDAHPQSDTSGGAERAD